MIKIDPAMHLASPHHCNLDPSSLYTKETIGIMKTALANHYGIRLDDIRESNRHEDYFECTDWAIDPAGVRWTNDPRWIKMSCRFRSYKFMQYKHEFTITTSSKQGKTEWEKIINGDVDIYFYGIVNKERNNFLQWILYDQHVFRSQKDRFLKSKNKLTGFIPYINRKHYDLDGNEVKFRAFHIRDFPGDFIIARSNNYEPEIQIAKIPGPEENIRDVVE